MEKYIIIFLWRGVNRENMLNGLNQNNELNNSQLDKQLGGIGAVVTNPIKNPYSNIDRNLLIDETAISNEAVNLYQKEQDVKKFNSIALSNPEDSSHEQIIEGLFQKGVCDPFSDETLQELVHNSKLLGDLEL